MSSGPGTPVDQEALRYLADGTAAGMLVPEAADAELRTVRVVAGR